MRGLVRVVLIATAVAGLTVPAAAQEVIAAIQVHGNTLTPDAKVIQASGLSIGAPFSDSLLESATRTLAQTGLFQHVEVLKRYASIADATQIVVVIRVDEGPVHVVPASRPGQPPTVARRSPLNLMFIPLLAAEDGYGLTYGVQLAVTGRSRTASRVVLPFSWGGNKRASAEFQHEFQSRWAPDISTGLLVQRRTHPFFRSDADRTRTWIRGQWAVRGPLSAGTTAAWQQASVLGETGRMHSVGGDVVLDTRVDPLLPGNAMYSRVAVDRMEFPSRRLVHTEIEVDGYLRIYRGNILVLRGAREANDGSAPPFYKSVLGGSGTLRGFRAGTAVGDTMVTTSAEVRIPLSSPLDIAKLGATVFMDAGTAYDTGQRLSDQHLRRGVGAGVWATAALFQLKLEVAHGIGAGTRVHFGAGLTF